MLKQLERSYMDSTLNSEKKETGKLYIFLGSAPGVGKTWAMVDGAQDKRAEGLDVVIGHIDTHDRPEFTALLKELPVIPFREIDYQGVHLREIDLDAIVQRHPDIVLIDELAHSNAPGARNDKRYKDVVELLQAGINVYTTLNVQHISSVADAVSEITGIQIREQVPDFILEMATSIRLIDLPPEELLNRLTKRLKQQKVGAVERPTGIDEFLTPSHLLTLRELALRVAATRVDEDVHSTSPDVEPWATSSKIMIGISASPNSERLIRATHRLVAEMHTTWLAVYIETPSDVHLGEEIRQKIQKHLDLAGDLGAETLTVAGQNAAEQLVAVAKQYGVSRIVLGRSKHKRNAFWQRPSLADQIIELSDAIDVLILAG